MIELIVATAVDAEVQTPPAVVLVNVVVESIHADNLPPIAANVGNALTVMLALADEIHPLVVTV